MPGFYCIFCCNDDVPLLYSPPGCDSPPEQTVNVWIAQGQQKPSLTPTSISSVNSLCLKWDPPPVQPSEGAVHAPQTPHQGARSRGPRVLLPELCSGVSVAPSRLLLSAAEKHREGENFPSAGFPLQPLGEFPLAPAPGDNLFSSSFAPLSPQGQDALPASRACWGKTGSHDGSRDSSPPRGGTVSWGEW